MSLRVGIDTVEVASVAAALAAHGDRYLQRVYTAGEVADCGGSPERLAARFAAKEAAFKALRAGAGGVPWPAVEVRRDPSGFTEIVLSGAAADLADQAGVTDLAVSLTHEAGLASAVVIATSTKVSGWTADRTERADPPRRTDR